MSEFICSDLNLYIEQKKSQNFQKIKIEKETLSIELLGEQEKKIKHEICLKEEVYACLYCESLKTAVLLVRKRDCYPVSFLFKEVQELKKFLVFFEQEMPTIQISVQNKKIHGYASALAEKLQEGIETTIIDTKEEEQVICCSVCGMQCDPNIPYCMECGAEISI